MSFEEYLECRRLHLVVMIFHNSRLLDVVYDYCQTVGITKSQIVSGILNSANPTFCSLLEQYLEETSNELFDTVDAVYQEDDLEKYSHNKIFRHMAIAVL